MWIFVVFVIINFFAVNFAKKYQAEISQHLSWMNEKLVELHKNNNVEQDKIDYAETVYVPTLTFWDYLGTQQPLINSIAQFIIYAAGLLTYFYGQVFVVNLWASAVEAAYLVLLVNMYVYMMRARTMTHNINDLVIESTGIKNIDKMSESALKALDNIGELMKKGKKPDDKSGTEEQD